MNKIVKNNKEYIVYCNNRQYSYSIKRYGKFAFKLARKTLKNKRKYNDYFIDFKKFTIFYINTIKFGVIKVFVDSEDKNKLFDLKISISKDNHAKTFYAKTKNGSVHRIVMNLKKFDKNIVDHINKNGLDNRKNNLRIVNNSINLRNQNQRIDNTSGVKGLCEDNKRFRVFWYDNNFIKKSKSFSKLKYGIKKAKNMAIEYRKSKEKEFGYL